MEATHPVAAGNLCLWLLGSPPTLLSSWLLLVAFTHPSCPVVWIQLPHLPSTQTHRA